MMRTAEAVEFRCYCDVPDCGGRWESYYRTPDASQAAAHALGSIRDAGWELVALDNDRAPWIEPDGAYLYLCPKHAESAPLVRMILLAVGNREELRRLVG